MKFDMHTFWKHENNMDAFLCVQGVHSDNGVTAILIAEWMCQGVDHYWTCPIPEHSDGSTIVKIEVNAENYGKWKPYTPTGKYLYSGQHPTYPENRKPEAEL